MFQLLGGLQRRRLINKFALTADRALAFQIKVPWKHVEGLSNPLLSLLPECLIQQVQGGARKPAFLVNFQVMVMLLVWEPQ